jgi:hypothetical protein
VTKKQMEAECKRLAPDFRIGPEPHQGRECIVARGTVNAREVLVAIPLGAWGRASVETTALLHALTSLRERARAN